MKRPLSTTLLITLIVLPITAIVAVPANTDSDAKKKTAIVLCGHCGEVKGSEVCCAKDATVCGCGAHKGSPACCKIKLSGQDVTLCNGCGHVKGTDVCCAADAAKCDGCGKAKGSPGCCHASPEHHGADHDGSEHKESHDSHE